MAKPICSVTICDRPARKRGWCETHYRRWRVNGDVAPDQPINSPHQFDGCTVETCGRPARERGWCKSHYSRWRRHGDVMADVPIGEAPRNPRNEAPCSVGGCDKRGLRLGWCETHYARWYRNGHLTPLKTPNGGWAGRVCLVEECCRPVRKLGLCASHYSSHQNRVRRARQRDVLEIPFSVEQLSARLSMFAGCWMCGEPADTVDHVKPIAAGGPHILANLRPACRSCNSSKGAQWPLAA